MKTVTNWILLRRWLEFRPLLADSPIDARRVSERQALTCRVDLQDLVDANEELCPPEPAGPDLEHLRLTRRLAVADPANTPEPLSRGLDEEAFAAAKPVLAAIARASRAIGFRSFGGAFRLHAAEANPLWRPPNDGPRPSDAAMFESSKAYLL